MYSLCIFLRILFLAATSAVRLFFIKIGEYIVLYWTFRHVNGTTGAMLDTVCRPIKTRPLVRAQNARVSTGV